MVAGLLAVGEGGPAASAGHGPTASPTRPRATLPTGFEDTVAIGSITQPVAMAFAPDGTAFIGLQTGLVKSFDYDAASGTFEPNASATDFADLSVEVDNYGDRGLTGI